MSEETKSDNGLKPHPFCAMTKAIARYEEDPDAVKNPEDWEKLKKDVAAECIKEGKVHPASKISTKYKNIESKFLPKKKSTKKKTTKKK